MLEVLYQQVDGLLLGTLCALLVLMSGSLAVLLVGVLSERVR